MGVGGEGNGWTCQEHIKVDHVGEGGLDQGGHMSMERIGMFERYF